MLRLSGKKNKEKMETKKLSACYFLLATRRKGFSFLEVIIAVFVLETGLLAGMTLITAGLRNSLDSRNQSIAGLLAQEGVELMRNLRDNNWVDSSDSFVNGAWEGSWPCRVDTASGLSGPGSYVLYYNTAPLAANKYMHNSGIPTLVPTQFSRKILIAKPNDDERVVTSMVTWGGVVPPATEADCTVAKKCAYTEVTLTRWKEN